MPTARELQARQYASIFRSSSVDKGCVVLGLTPPICRAFTLASVASMTPPIRRLCLPSRAGFLCCTTAVIAQGVAVRRVSDVLQFDDRHGRWLSEHRDESQNYRNFPRSSQLLKRGHATTNDQHLSAALINETLEQTQIFLKRQ